LKFYIVDDYYPWPLSSFRIAEFNWYLKKYPGCHAFSMNRNFREHHDAFSKIFPELSGRVSHAIDMFDAPDLFYNIFINNAADYLPIYEKESTPFSFTLYPGGGFHLEDEVMDAQLQRVGDSDLLQEVIVTQMTTKNYILDKGFVSPEKVHFIFGGALDSATFKRAYVPRKKYGVDKETFDICFVAVRYDPRGVTKGYDVFLEVARKLAAWHPDIRFHVVGGARWDIVDETDTSFLGDRVTEYGLRDTAFFPEFHSGMDMIISPNRPFCHPPFPGAFDGFPTGCCVEAGMCGTPVLCTDLLNDNVVFEDGKDIRIIPYDVDGICDIVTTYFEDLEKLYALGEGCREAFLRVFDIETQMAARVKALGLE